MTIVAAVDRSDRAQEVLEQAVPLAEVFDVPLHVVHVLTRSELADLERANFDETGSALEMDEVREVAADIAADAAAGLETPYEAVGLVGDPADRIVEYSEEQDARYIVVAGRKRSPTGKMIFGSVAQSVLVNADRPVVTSIEQ